jgi:RNA polymerase sigma-70 factor (ECF subfamily)
MKKMRSFSDGQMPEPDTWVEQYGDYLYRYAVSRCQDPSIAEDLVQETFLAALRSRESFEGRSSVRTWLTSILRNKIVDHFRKISMERPIDDFESPTAFTDEAFDKEGNWKVGPAKWNINPMKIFEQKEFWRVLSNCLSEVPARLARAFILREIDGLNCEEIRNVLHVSASNCWVMLYRTRMRMRQCLEMNWFGDNAFEDS